MRLQLPSCLSLFGVCGVALSVDLSEEDRTWKVRPVMKVVHLLKDMSGKIQEEAKTDEETFDKLACWCETNDQEKTKSIKVSTRRIDELEATISSLAAQIAGLQVDTKQLLKESTEKGKALGEAAEIRKEEQKKFQNSEKDMIASITSLKNAVVTLGQANGESLLQVQHLIWHHMEKLKQRSPPTSASTPMSFLQRELVAAPSGAIFGILKGMKETFEQNLASAQKDEAQAEEEYEGLKATKEREIEAGDNLRDSKNTELADAEKTKSQARQDLDDTRAALSSDTETLRNLRLACQKADHEAADRTQTRNEELRAISDTIQILTDDDAKETMDRATVNGLLQLRLQNGILQPKLQEAAAILRQAALKNFGSASALLQLASSIRSNPFGFVLQSLDGLIAELRKTQKDEVEQKEFCAQELNENELKATQRKNTKDDIEQKIEEMAGMMGRLSSQVKRMKEQVSSARAEIAKASENREAENRDFQTTIMDQRATQQILKKAGQRLKAFYGVQLDQESIPEGMPEDGTYKKSSGAVGVLSMLEMIVEESKDVEQKAMAAENEAQRDYETFTKDSDASIRASQAEIGNKSNELAKLDGDTVTSKSDLAHTMDDLQTLSDYRIQLRSQCDDLTENFQKVQSARAEEIEALRSAKTVLVSQR